MTTPYDGKMVHASRFQMIGRRAWAAFALLAPLLWLSAAEAQFGRQGPAAPRARAEPPASWPPTVISQFFQDAFAELDGPRPDFSAVRLSATNTDRSDEQGDASDTAGSWSSFISGDTLVDEIKTTKMEIDKIIAKKRDFTGGGYIEARDGFSSIAAAFGVIAVYDGDVRWKDGAARARDRFAAAAFECNQGNDKTFVVATQASEDLQKLISGSRLEGPVAKQVEWQRIAARQPLMARLSRAEKTLAEVSASDATFAKEPERLLHAAEMVAMIGEFMQQPKCEDFDDDTYRGYATTMRDAAARAAAATRAGDFAAAQSAISALRKSCDTCHGDYR
jgi:cytochrome c556